MPQSKEHSPSVVLFDLGGVLLRLRPQDSVAAFAKLGAPKFEAIWDHDTSRKSIHRFEVGAIDVPTFRAEMNDAMGTQLPDATFDAAFCAMLGPIAPSAFELMGKLKKQYRVCLLSNNNALHLAAIERDYPHLRGEFEIALFSQEIAEHKPAPAAFHKAAHAIGCEPSSIVFIDDSQANIDAAIAAGMQGQFHPRNTDIAEAMAHLL